MASDVDANDGFLAEEAFFRRIPYWQFDFNNQTITNNAFRNDRLDTGENTDRHSVNWEKCSSVDHALKGHPGFGLAVILAVDCHVNFQSIEHTPKPTNLSHCDVVGEKTGKIQRALRKAAILLVPPSAPQN